MIYQFKKQYNKNSTVGFTLPKSKQKALRSPKSSRTAVNQSPSKVNYPNCITDIRFNKNQEEENVNVLTPLELNDNQMVTEVNENESPLDQSYVSSNQEKTPRFFRTGSEIFNKSISSEHITMKRQEFFRIITDLKNQKELSWDVHLHQIENLENTIKSIELDYQNLFKEIQSDHIKQIEEIQRQNDRKLQILRRQQQTLLQKLKENTVNSQEDHQQRVEGFNRIRQQHFQQIQALKSLHHITIEQANAKHKSAERLLKKQIEQLYRQNQKNKVQFSHINQTLKQSYDHNIRNSTLNWRKNQQVQALESQIKSKDQNLKNALELIECLNKQKEEMTISFEQQINETANFYHSKMEQDNQFSQRQFKQLQKKYKQMEKTYQRQKRQIEQNSQQKIRYLQQIINSLQHKRYQTIDLNKSASDPHFLMPTLQENAMSNDKSHDQIVNSNQYLIKRINQKNTFESQEFRSHGSQKDRVMRLGQSQVTSFQNSRLVERRQEKIEQLERQLEAMRVQIDIQQLQRKNIEEISQSQIKRLIDYDLSHEKMTKQLERLRQERAQFSKKYVQGSKYRQSKYSCTQFMPSNQRKKEKQIRNQEDLFNTIGTVKKYPILNIPFSSEFDRQIPKRRPINLDGQNSNYISGNKNNDKLKKAVYESPAYKISPFQTTQLRSSKNIQNQVHNGQLIQKYVWKIRKLQKDNLMHLEHIQALENTNSTLRKKVLKNLQGFENEKKMYDELNDLKVQLRRSEHKNKTLSLMNDSNTITSFRQNRLRDSKEIPSLRRLPFSQFSQAQSPTNGRSNKRIHTVNVQQERSRQRQRGLKYSMIENQRHRRQSSVTESNAKKYSQVQEYDDGQVSSKKEFNLDKFMKRLEVNSIVKSKIFNQ